jgi:hypothetical protein
MGFGAEGELAMLKEKNNNLIKFLKYLEWCAVQELKKSGWKQNNIQGQKLGTALAKEIKGQLKCTTG